MSSNGYRELAQGAWIRLPHPVRWIGVAVVGSVLIAIGIVLLVLPGPGIAFIALGLLVLATEFAWAQRTLHRLKTQSSAALSRITPRKNGKES